MFGNRIKEHNSHVTSTFHKYSVINIHPWSSISHFKIIDKDSKQFAREAREAIHIRINNPALNCNTGKMCIQEIFNHLLGANGSTNDSNKVVDSDLSQGHTHLTLQSSRFSREVCLTNLITWALLLTKLGSFPVISCQVLGPSTSKFKFILGAKEVLCTSRICS